MNLIWRKITIERDEFSKRIPFHPRVHFLANSLSGAYLILFPSITGLDDTKFY